MWKGRLKSTRSKTYKVDGSKLGASSNRKTKPFELDTFLMAAKNGDNEKITYQLRCKDSDVNAVNKRGNTALHIACIHGKLDTVKLLIQNGATVNHQSKHGYTPLYNAAMENHPEVVTELLASGADRSIAPQVRGKRCTPLEIAELQGFREIIKILKEEN